MRGEKSPWGTVTSVSICSRTVGWFPLTVKQIIGSVFQDQRACGFILGV